MAGKAGRSGGARAGAGRKPGPEKPEPPPLAAIDGQQPLDFLLSVQNDPLATPALRVRAAIAAAQYVHTKLADGGKKEAQLDAAEKVASRFSTSAPPKLAAVGGRKIGG